MAGNGSDFKQQVLDFIRDAIIEAGPARAFANVFLMLLILTAALVALNMTTDIVNVDDFVSNILLMALGIEVVIFLLAWIVALFRGRGRSNIRLFDNQEELYKHLTERWEKIGKGKKDVRIPVRATHVWNEIDLVAGLWSQKHFHAMSDLLARPNPPISLERILRLPADPEKRRSALKFALSLLKGDDDVKGLEGNPNFTLRILDEKIDRKAYMDVLVIGDSDTYTLIRSTLGGDPQKYCHISDRGYAGICTAYSNSLLEDAEAATVETIERELRWLDSPGGKELTERLIDEVWNKGNVGHVKELVSEDFRFHYSDKTLDPTGYRRFLEEIRYAFPDPAFKLEDQTVEHNKVTCRWTINGTHKKEYCGIPPTDNSVAVSGISVFRIEGDKIAEGWASWDELGLMKQLGVVPKP